MRGLLILLLASLCVAYVDGSPMTRTTSQHGLFAIIGDQLFSINTSTAAPTLVGSFPAVDLMAQGECTLDSSILWCLTENATSAAVSVVGLSLQSGVVVKQFAVPLAGQGLVGVGSFIDLEMRGKLLIGGPSQTRIRYHDLFSCSTNSGEAGVERVFTCRLLSSFVFCFFQFFVLYS